jgi:hypothetical protein
MDMLEVSYRRAEIQTIGKSAGIGSKRLSAQPKAALN